MLSRRLIRSTAAAVPLVALVASCGSQSSGGPSFDGNVTIVLNQPATGLPYVARFTQQGATLAAGEINARGGVKVGGKSYKVHLEQLDNQLSPSTSLDNVKKAVSEKAVAIIEDGYTTEATSEAAGTAGIPVMVDYNGDATLVDTARRPNVFRIAPPDDAVAAKLVAYLGTRGVSQPVLVHDDSAYGKDGETQFITVYAKKGVRPLDMTLPASAPTYATQALRVRQRGATGVIVWARAPAIAAFVKDLRQAGSTATVFAGPTAEDPVVRTQLADHPDWVEGITYASFRITTEGGPDAWDKFRGKYEDARMNDGQVDFRVGVKARDGKDVVQPPDWQLFPYDMVYLVKAALEKAGTVDPTGGRIIEALNTVQVKSGNGDNRGWTRDSHEGVADDDIVFNVFADMKFKPVQDDPLSRSLPPVDQE